MLARCGERGSLLPCWWECKLVQPLWKTVWRFLKKLKIELPYDPPTALLGIYPKDTGVVFRRGTCTPMFIAALATIAELPFATTWMELEGIMLSEIRERQKSYDFTHETKLHFKRQNMNIREGKQK